MKGPLNFRAAFRLALCGLSLACLGARAQTALPHAAARSVSGMFVVIGEHEVSSLRVSSDAATNADVVRLDPPLLAICAERIREAVQRQLGMVEDAGSSRSRIYLALHPAESLDENVNIISGRFGDVWVYRVDLPDVLSRSRLVRAITGAVLLEYANLSAGARSAELPPWMVTGLSAQVLAENFPGFIPSAPDKTIGGLPETRFFSTRRGWDPLAGARRVLGTHPALTVEELSWPTGRQLSGGDGGIYRASAQLFVSRLLGLPDGPAHVRGMLRLLPRYYNWQFAFRGAFGADFPKPADLDKWWTLQTLDFSAQGGGPSWTPEASRTMLAKLLSVPVEFWASSNSLPFRASTSLQAIIRNFGRPKADPILLSTLQELQMAQLQMSPQFAVLASEYSRTLAGYLGQTEARHFPGKSWWLPRRLPDGGRTIAALNTLDARRRRVEVAMDGTNDGAVAMPGLTARGSNL